MYLRFKVAARGGASTRALIIALSAPLAVAVPLSAACAGGVLPASGQYVSGSGTITKAGKSGLTIDQSSTTGIIDWNSFSIGRKNSVSFDNGSGATLNRVTGGNLSTIAGSLKATGSLYLINPQGMIVSGTGHVLTGGNFVGSSRDLSDDDFSHGKRRFTGTSKGAVVNQGSIRSANGDVALIGSSGSNSGSLSASHGSASLSAGNTVLLAPAGSGGRILVSGGTGNAVNSGSIAAAQAQLDAAGGNVYALSGNNGGIIRATGTKTVNGHIWLKSDDGETKVTGDLIARNADHKGGSIETSGRSLSIGGNIDAGSGGKWLVDPENLEITASSALTIDKTLNKGTNVTLETTSTSASSTGTKSKGAGDISLESSLEWHTNASLTVSAYHNVVVGNDVTVTNFGYGSLILRADNTGLDRGTLEFGEYTDLNWSKSTGSVDIFYNPSGSKKYQNAVDFSSEFSRNPNDNDLQLFADMLVNNVSDLQAMSENLNGDYALGKNIDASATANWNSGAGFIPIGDDNDSFSGRFYGQGYTISNLKLDTNTDLDNVGLFSTVSGILEDFTLAEPTLNTSSATSSGDVFGSNAGSIYNVRVTNGGLGGTNTKSGYIDNAHTSAAGVQSRADAHGGNLVGENDGTIENSSSSGSVLVNTSNGGTDDVGGLVGLNTGTIENSFSTVSVTDQNAGGNGDVIGGLVGYNNGIIKYSFATGKVIGGDYSGGLVGYNDNYIDQTYATGAVQEASAGDYGAFVGDNNATITNSYARGSINSESANSYVGGFVGYNSWVIEYSYSTGKITGNGNAGGFAGSSTGTTTDCYWDSDTSGYSGGDIGIATALTTAQLESGLPTGFSSSYWVHKKNSFPILAAIN